MTIQKPLSKISFSLVLIIGTALVMGCPATAQEETSPENQKPDLSASFTAKDLYIKRKEMNEKLLAEGAELICNIPQGSCGSLFHTGIRFSYLGGNEVYGVYYLRKLNTYYVVGKAEVTDSIKPEFNKTVEDQKIDAPYKPDTSPLIIAAQASSIDMTLEYLKKADDVNASDKDGRTALHFAVLNNQADLVRILLENGAKTNVKEHSSETGFNGWGWYPLHLALRNGNNEIVKLLVKHGADINQVMDNGQAPIHLAAVNGDIGTVKFLINQKAKLNIKDKSGKTPLYEAAYRGYADIVELLLANGVKPDNRTNEYKSLLRTVTDGLNAYKEGKNPGSRIAGESVRNWAKTKQILLKYNTGSK